MRTEATDESLMLAYREGDVAAFEILHGRYRSRLYRYVLNQCGDASRADELYQEIWLKVVRARQRYEVSAKFSTWLFRIAHNRLIDHFRESGRAAMLTSYDDDDCPLAESAEFAAPSSEQPERRLERKALAERLLQEVRALPAAQREVFLLAEEGGMSLEEIAAATGVGRETAKSRLRYALGKLRQSLKEWK